MREHISGGKDFRPVVADIRARSATVVSNRKFLKIEIFGCKNQSCGLQPSVLLGTSLAVMGVTHRRALFFHCS
jgi:hypothetical protein